MEIQAASLSEKAALGQGYNVEQEEFVGQCVRGGVEFAGNQQSQLTFDRSMSQEAASSELGFHVGGKARYGLFSGSLAATFASESTSSEYSDVTIYSHIISFKNAKFRFPGVAAGLTPEGIAAKGTAADDTFVGEHWPVVCGHQFVSQITLGAKLLVSVKVEFATREEKQAFSGEFTFQGPPVEVEASLRMASQKFGKRASLSLHAFQLGGDVRRLSSVFGTGPGQAPILVASLENPGAVLDALNAAVVYGRDEFSAQVNPDAPLDSPNGPAQLSYITSPWEELGLFAPPPIVAAGVVEARRQLSDEFERHAGYSRRISQVLNGPMRLSPRQLDRFKEMQRIVTRNLAIIQEAALVCYSDFERAPRAVADAVAQLQDFTRDEFDVQPESFAQWWDIKDLPGTLQADRQALLDIAAPFIPQFVNFDQIPKDDQGTALQHQIEQLEGDFPTEVSAEMFNSRAWSVIAESKLTELTLVCLNSDVASLKPLHFTPRLRNLSSLGCLAIPIDPAPLAGLPDLEKLSIQKTTVDAIESLGSAPNLVEIRLEGPVEDVSPLRSATKLEQLRIGHANVTDVSPLAGLSNLTGVFLPGSPVASIEPLLGLDRLVGFTIGSPTVAVAGMDRMVALPRFQNFVANAGRLAMHEHPTSGLALSIAESDVVWTRRGTTNLFDTVTTDTATGQETVGVGAFTGVQASDQGMMVTFMQARGGVTTQYMGFIPVGEQAVSGLVSLDEGVAGEWEAQVG
ncbi:MAG: hypothetical protein M3Q23_17950 [Actinomycetota bacterium]|nr:hypothetical protein [Actinomycetota bacterium]